MRKIKNYKTFENFERDINAEEKIDQVIEDLLKKKNLISMLNDTINHVCNTIEKTLPLQLEEFMEDLHHYDEEIFQSVDSLKDKMIDGYPNLKDIIEEVLNDIETIENYMKLKKK